MVKKIPSIVLKNIDYHDIEILEGEPPFDFTFRFPNRGNPIKAARLAYDFQTNLFRIQLFAKKKPVLDEIVTPYSANLILENIVGFVPIAPYRIPSVRTAAVIAPVGIIARKLEQWGMMEYRIELNLRAEELISMGAGRFLVPLDKSLSIFAVEILTLLKSKYPDLEIILIGDSDKTYFAQSMEKVSRFLPDVDGVLLSEDLDFKEKFCYVKKKFLYAISESDAVLLSVGGRPEKCTHFVDYVQFLNRPYRLIHQYRVLFYECCKSMEGILECFGNSKSWTGE